MKKMIFFSALFVGFVAHAAELKLKIGPSPATALPVSISSCAANQTGTYPQVDLSSPTFAFTTFNYQWTGTDSSFSFAFIEINLKSPALVGGSYQCVIAGDELEAVLNSQSTIPAGDSVMKKSLCGLRCGGFNVLPDSPSSFIQGVAKVVGTESDIQGHQTPIITQVPVSVEYSSF